MGRFFSIGDLGKAAGLKPHTIRYYERRGLLPRALRNQAGYRRYSDSDLVRLRLVIAAKNLGFTLREIASMAAEQNRLSLSTLLKPRLKAKSVEIEKKLKQLRAVRRQVQKAFEVCGHNCICVEVDGPRRGGTERRPDSRFHGAAGGVPVLK